MRRYGIAKVVVQPFLAPIIGLNRIIGGNVLEMKRATTVGIIGGGQLARMMYQAATTLDVPIKLLAEDATVCAAKIVNQPQVGDYTDSQTLAEFAAECDVITFDHEHVPTSDLIQLSEKGVGVFPGPQALKHAQDKAIMRAKMDQLGVPNPIWRVVASPSELVDFGNEIGWPIIAKTSRGGYDGKGVWKITTPDQAGEPFENLPEISAGEKVLVIAEEFIDFYRELSAIVVRSPSGQMVSYPVSETVQKDGICVETITPAPNMSDELAGAIQQMALKIADELQVVGVLAVELMQRKPAAQPSGEQSSQQDLLTQIVVNELAMRPHNTGHWSIDGANTSQFENHIRAVLDLPLGAADLRAKHVVMANVLGGTVTDLTGALLHCFARDPQLKVHIYGKEVRAGRKIAHVTAYGDDLDDVVRRARHAANFLMGVEDA